MFSLNISGIFDRAVDIHKKYLKSIVLYQLIMTIVVSAIAFIGIFVIILITAFGSIGFIAGRRFSSAAVVFLIILFIVLATFIYTVSSLGTVGMMDVVKGDYTSRKVDMSAMFTFTFKYFFKVLGVSFVMVLVLLPVLAAWGGIGWLIFNSIDRGIWFSNIAVSLLNQPVYFIILMVIFTLLVLFSILIYKTLYIFSIHAVVFQNKNFFRALSESRRLIKGDFWRIMGYTLMFYFVVWALFSAVNSFFILVTSVFMYFLKFFSASNSLLANIQLLSSVITWPMRILEQLFITPLSGLFVTLLYFKQRFKKDGYDIVLRLEGIKNMMRG